MKVRAVQEAVREVVSDFFTGGTVWWTNQKMPRPKSPYIMLALQNFRRNQHGAEYMDTETGYITRYTETTVSMVMDLYEVGLNESETIKNTVLDDMESFIMFIESDAITDRLDALGIALAVRDNSIQELSDILNDAQFRYRARAVFDLRFQNDAVGPYGQNGITAGGAGGGGKSEYSEAEAEYFTAMEATGELES